MGVKQLLQKQDASFISLHDLLLKMTLAGDGCSLEEAAIVLFRLMDSSEYPNRPQWLMKSKVEGVRAAHESINFSGKRCLKHAAKFGKFEPAGGWDWGVDAVSLEARDDDLTF